MSHRAVVCWANALFRVFACGLAVTAWVISISEPRSMFALLATSGEGARLLLAMALFGSIGIADFCINDLHPKWRVKPAQTYRHFGFCALAFCYVSQVFVSNIHLQSSGMAAYLLWNAFALVAFAFIDANQRYKGTLHAFA